ncbi:MAG: tripartite tricarboxylate transporter TctB family protein [Fusobacteriaceae bacterium]|jgi:hypothetical protein|nr:tripartite tricarboxylate transporter TctB family protein [Fusobacteriaceae bacterium]
MKKTDIGVVAFMYAVCALFFALTLGLKKEAQTYPLFILLMLFLLTTGYVVKMLIDAKKKGVSSGLAEVFEGFLPGQFIPLLVMIVLYLILIYVVGFYIATVAFVTVSLIFLKIKRWQILLTNAALICLIYCSFTLFLGVHLPAGMLFG